MSETPSAIPLVCIVQAAWITPGFTVAPVSAPGDELVLAAVKVRVLLGLTWAIDVVIAIAAVFPTAYKSTSDHSCEQ